MRTSGNMELVPERLNKWEKHWDVKVPFWHRRDVNQFLERHWNKCGIDSAPARVFVPLCGKTIDMKWIYDQGHSVVGLDGVVGPVKDFFQEHNLEYKEDVKDGLVRFSTIDERLEIYICDMMETNPTKFGKFDLIWDRGSLVAINCEDRNKYANFMKAVIGPQTRYLLNSIMYDQSRYSGPPMSVTHEVINELYGDLCAVETLQTVPRDFAYLSQCGAAPNDQEEVVVDNNEAYEVIVLMKPQ